jgi:hypothetical protein
LGLEEEGARNEIPSARGTEIKDGGLEVDICPSDEEAQLAPGFMEDDLGRQLVYSRFTNITCTVTSAL